jgi:hypothetical protein
MKRMNKFLSTLALYGAIVASGQSTATAQKAKAIPKATIQNIVADSLKNCNEKKASIGFNDVRYGSSPGQHTGSSRLFFGDNQYLFLATIKRADGVDVQMYGATPSSGGSSYCAIPEKHHDTVRKYLMQQSQSVKSVTFPK